MRLVDEGKERKADEAKKLEEVGEVQGMGTGMEMTGTAEMKALKRARRKAAQFARGDIVWDEPLGAISRKEAAEALAALHEANEAKGERLRGARRRAARYARGEVLVDDEALGLVEGEETSEERTEAGRAKRAGSLQNMQQGVEEPRELQAPSKEKAKPRPPPRRQEEEEEEEEDSPPPKLTRRKQARVLAKKAARRQKADAETAAALAG
ncbi:hypothetical protein LTR74_000748 [Friedmanniomyces endolithicus]|nr:hypothetical protein LTR74_000748 [Friedmanniomyces endolithicus]